MAKKCYVGVDSTARQVKKIYVGVDGVARKVKKGYVGVGGVARPFWAGGTLTYYGKITDRTRRNYHTAGASTQNYALFAGGFSWSSSGAEYATKTVNAYDRQLTRSEPKELSVDLGYMTGVSFRNYALFAGGRRGYSSDKESANIYIYTDTLTSQGIRVLPNAPIRPAGCSSSAYAVFGGGGTKSSSENKVSSLNADLTVTSLTALTASTSFLSAASVASQFIFAGGAISKSSSTDVVTVYGTDLTKFTGTPLPYAVSNLAATAVGNYAIFAGGYAKYTLFSAAVAYSSDLTQITLDNLGRSRQNLTGITLDDYAIFAGGADDYDSSTSFTDIYSSDLTKTTLASIPGNTNDLAAAKVGDYALFTGGNDNNKGTAKVYVYAVV